MANCSIEKLYADYGRFDYTVQVYFFQDTASCKKFGNYITGVLYFTQKERISLEANLASDPTQNNDGQVKIQIFSSDYDKNLKDELINVGFMASHVCNVDAYKKPTENKFAVKETRKLPEPMIINVDRGSDEEGERMMMGMYSSMTNGGNKLTPYEQNEYRGYIYKYCKSQLTEAILNSDFIDSKTGKIKDEILYHALRSKYNAHQLDDEQTKIFEEIVGRFQSEKVALLKQELNGTQESLKNLAKNYPNALEIILHILPHFKPKRLLHGKYPVYLDIQGFIHIFVRHVGETQIGAKNKNDKSAFQYAFHEVIELLEMVVKQIDNEIETHFTANPTVDFVRKGDKLVYFQGDYFYIHILASGRVSTFYKSIPKSDI